MMPNDIASRARLEVLYRLEGRWVELAASLEERTILGSAPSRQTPNARSCCASSPRSTPTSCIASTMRSMRSSGCACSRPPISGILFQLADLYAAIGRWSKVIESLARVGEIAEGSDEARAALRKIAQIHEKELELPERAIESYVQMVATWPDDAEAWASLDGLYVAQARWNELADVLRRRAALARDPAERAQLLARRAGVLLDWLASPKKRRRR